MIAILFTWEGHCLWGSITDPNLLLVFEIADIPLEFSWSVSSTYFINCRFPQSVFFC